MSYDVTLRDPCTNATIVFPEKHHMRGGTFEVGGTREAWLNVTYNYGPHFERVLGPEGLQTLHRQTGGESTALLEKAISLLKDDVSDNYWDPTEGNAKRALLILLDMANAEPGGIWDVD